METTGKKLLGRHMPFPAGTADAYHAAVPELVKWVDESVLGHPDRNRLCGDNADSLMRNNHRNHARFMESVMRYDQLDVFLHTLPWVYRTYLSRGLSEDYFPLVLRTFLEGMKTRKDEALAPVIDWYCAVLSLHEEMLAASAQPLEAFDSMVLWTDAHEALLQSLIAGDADAAYEAIREGAQDRSVAERYQSLVQPVMYRIGKLWEEDAISVAHEHLATATLSRVLAQCYLQQTNREALGFQILVSAGVNETHQLGARMVADLLEREGYDVTYLGSDTPMASLLRLIEERRPDMIALSITMAYHAQALKETVDAIRDLSPGLPVMAGGLAIRENPELSRVIGADAAPVDFDEMLETIEKWRRHGQPA